MDPYIFCLCLGFVGLILMALSGIGQHGAGGHGHGAHSHSDLGHGGHAHGELLHGGHAHGASGHGHAAHGHAGHSHSADGHGTHTHHSHEHGESRGAQTAAVAGGSNLATSLMSWLSPRVLFSVLMGFGATGIFIQKLTQEPVTLALAVVGGWGFERLIVSPFWNLLMGFSSNPARTLETAVAEEARAVTDFDSNGNGLIALDMDGQVFQVLATLRAADRTLGLRVRTGDRLFVESVDTHRNSCVVSALNGSTLPSSALSASTSPASSPVSTVTESSSNQVPQ